VPQWVGMKPIAEMWGTATSERAQRASLSLVG